MSWLLLEAHLGILAACLPTIHVLFKGLSPESVINSIRSVLSLHSLNFTRSQIVDDEETSHRGLVAEHPGLNVNKPSVDGNDKWKGARVDAKRMKEASRDGDDIV